MNTDTIFDVSLSKAIPPTFENRRLQVKRAEGEQHEKDALDLEILEGFCIPHASET